MARIAQLTNKSNQCNLTTRRYTQTQIEEAAQDPSCITLYGKLEDKFGDNGVVSVLIGHEGPDSAAAGASDDAAPASDSAAAAPDSAASVPAGASSGRALHLDLWLMSCRVLKRDMEYAMMDVLVEKCRERGIRTIFGYYYPTAKNGMVRDFYGLQGFEKIREDEAGSVWRFVIPERYENQNHYIETEK